MNRQLPIQTATLSFCLYMSEKDKASLNYTAGALRWTNIFPEA